MDSAFVQRVYGTVSQESGPKPGQAKLVFSRLDATYVGRLVGLYARQLSRERKLKESNEPCCLRMAGLPVSLHMRRVVLTEHQEYFLIIGF